MEGSLINLSSDPIMMESNGNRFYSGILSNPFHRKFKNRNSPHIMKKERQKVDKKVSLQDLHEDEKPQTLLRKAHENLIDLRRSKNSSSNKNEKKWLPSLSALGNNKNYIILD